MRAIFAVLGLSLGGGLAYWALAAISTFDDGRSAPLIADLDHDDFARREQAEQALRDLGETARYPLMDALANNPSAEKRLRADRLLQELDSRPETRGLRLELGANRAKIKVGDEWQLRTVIRNLGSREINLYVGKDPLGVHFKSGKSLARVSDDGSAEAPAASTQSYICHHVMGPRFMTLAPGKTVAYDMPAKLERRPNDMLQLKLGDSGLFHVDAPDEGKLRLRLVHTVTEQNFTETTFNNGGLRPTNERARFWTGTMRSNVIEVEVIPDQ